jgi:hypothetical protein
MLPGDGMHIAARRWGLAAEARQQLRQKEQLARTILFFLSTFYFAFFNFYPVFLTLSRHEGTFRFVSES